MRAHNPSIRLTLMALALSTLFLAGCGSDDDPTAPGGGGGGSGPTVLLLGDGRTEAHASATLSAAGFTVRDGGLFYEFDGSGLEDVAAVVLLAGHEYDNDMNDQGEAALVTFVGAGGGLLTTEWLAFSIERSGYHQIVETVLPVTYADSYGSGSETYTVMVDHPVTEGLPTTFATENDNHWSMVGPKAGVTQLVRGSNSGYAVTTWTRNGRVVSWNMAGEYDGRDIWNANIEKLLVNAVSFVSRR